MVSCNKEVEKTEVNQSEISALRAVVEHSVSEVVSNDFQMQIADWNELNVLKNFLDRFIKASPKEVLSNSLELRDLIKLLKESKKSILFQNPSFETRVNILYNESLRLADMNTIPAITANEVNTQVDKILDAFSAVNAKINTIFSKKKFEDEIDIDLRLIGLDSTKIDTISRISILKRNQEKILREKELNNLKREN
ncbi:MAG: hypothetical protein COZ16_07230 [Flavobacteriaceae bacterium CG_4_10_14_3_um_filter_31_253]|nr:MAG: hypothetical protein AUK46_04020 [Flavobacteriaceae bacterium CG2_30_31_66]PIV97370.1 MAG: hypothetical protein COW43_02990 [Flavobacteriaceae bacterium CG17_big_fil_post_rev_8_21_14_2_50_31_13]PIX14233.1 MAG: hypothetical protein COZ74_03610 [Flavobacteriaceae bacterium CG_4_8_14_3_um_filter_31_8]PIY14728.1 MAG: hypothetical protein COZ16_07230 [Flavobacteriaceae bacterium CG_4_10_14_3_um_filter_31_253]PIZ12077.1 MAG: hypothetical protein COY55_01250 [Flavobacteriaceae bacterium CG_4_1